MLTFFYDLYFQVLQKDIESHSKIISSVLKVCERLQTDNEDESASDKESVKAVAVNLERRWHNIWLQSLEWQCRLEEALAGKVGVCDIIITS